MKIARLRNIRKIVKEILEDEPLSREDDFYLILKVVQKLYPEDYCKSFSDVMLGMKYKRLSFERNNESKKESTRTISRIKG